MAHGPAKNVLVDLWLASGLARLQVEQLLAGSGLAPDEFALYGLVVDLAPVTAADLARATGMPATTLSGLLARCEARGELERRPDPADRRGRLLALTPTGEARYRAVLPAFAELLAGLDAVTPLPIPGVRFQLQALDQGLRRLGGHAPRPYAVDPGPARELTYPGPALDAAQQREVLAFIDWVRHRDGRPAGTVGGRD